MVRCDKDETCNDLKWCWRFRSVQENKSTDRKAQKTSFYADILRLIQEWYFDTRNCLKAIESVRRHKFSPQSEEVDV